MADSKNTLIETLRRCAILMEIRGENPFRCRAYENAARALESIEGQPAEWLASGALAGVKGVGKGIVEHIEEFVATGQIANDLELRAELPPGLLQMAAIPGLGPKKIKALWTELKLDTVEALAAAARDGRVAGLTGFGEKTAAKILAGIEQREKFSERHLASVAQESAAAIVALLRALPGVERAEPAGSLRRRRETVKDLDFVAVSAKPEAVMKAFVSMPEVARVVNHGETKSSVLLKNGIPADLRVVAADQFAAALNYFTGSKEHNTAVRGRAKRMGLKLNEYGLFREDASEPEPCPDEAAIYKRLGLAYVEPEMREDMGEIEAAEAGELPRLITMEDMRGLLHCHSTYSDGRASLAEMADAARAAGYQYFGICDHSQTAFYAHGLKEDDLKRQHEEIDRLNERHKDFTILKGIESDILGGGELDYPDSVLASFDFIVASVHSRFQMSREEMTARIVRAIENPATVILGHPTGRLLLEREPYSVDMDAVLEAAARHKVAVEINANPRRLDLDWRQVRKAKKLGCLLSINPDAHRVSGIADNEYGIGIARKGWLEAGDVINTMDLKHFRKWLEKRRDGETGVP